MRKITALVVCFFSVLLPVVAQHKVILKVTVPGSVREDSFFVAGNFNKWNPAAVEYRFQPRDKFYNQGILSFTVPQSGAIEYKITRGSWSTVECGKLGFDIGNRRYEIISDTIITIEVAGWKDKFPKRAAKSTASQQVQVLDTAMKIAQLQRTRTVRVYLPKDYSASRKKYPVLYMHDGQNLFDATLNPFGEWGVDEYLDSARRQCIIIAIDHGGGKRLNEYNPYPNVQYGDGEGEAYAQFLVKTLKPLVDKKYRTLKDAKHTYIAGSSMGGLISWYAALTYPKVFGKAGVFSPAFWIGGPQVNGEIMKAPLRKGQGYYFYAGQQESETMVTDMVRVFGSMQQLLPANNYRVSIKADGRHNEAAWRAELPAFFKWLLQ